VTETGEVYLIDSQGDYAKLVNLATNYSGAGIVEGAVVVPNDPAVWGQYAGDILVTAENSTTVWAISPDNGMISSSVFAGGELPQMQVTAVNIPGMALGIENMNVVPSNANFFGISVGASLFDVPSASLSASSLTGDILATSEFGGPDDVIYYSNGQLAVTSFSLNDNNGIRVSWEQVNFGSAAVGGAQGSASTMTILSGRTVYIDLTNTGHWESGDPTTVTDSNGDYSFTGLAAGTYTVAEELPAGWVQIVPSEPSYSVTLDAGENTVGIDFASEPGTVAPDHPPVFTSTPPAIAYTGQQYRYSFTAYDPDPGDAISYDLPEHPDGMYIDDSIPGHPAIVWNVPANPTEFGRFLLRATDNHGESAIQPFTIDLVNPVVPVLEASAASSTAVNLSWAPIPGAAGYFIEASTDPNFTGLSSSAESGSSDWLPVSSTGLNYGVGGNVVYTVTYLPQVFASLPNGGTTSLQPGVTYYFRIEANMTGFYLTGQPVILPVVSENSNTAIAATFSSPVTVPAKPVGLTATVQTGGVELTWIPNSDGITQSYDIYRNNSNSFATATPLATVTQSPNSYVQLYTYLDPTGTPYSFYWIVPCTTADGSSPFVSQVSDVAYPNVPPLNAPIITGITASSTPITSTSVQLTADITDPLGNTSSRSLPRIRRARALHSQQIQVSTSNKTPQPSRSLHRCR
jgi:hypothetical protein